MTEPLDLDEGEVRLLLHALECAHYEAEQIISRPGVLREFVQQHTATRRASERLSLKLRYHWYRVTGRTLPPYHRDV